MNYARPITLVLSLILALVVSLAAQAQTSDVKVPGNQSIGTSAPSEPPSMGKTGGDEVGTLKTARVFFVSPKNGAVVKRTSVFKFAVEGLKVAPAGEILPGTGHFHIIVDGEAVKEGEIVPADAKHIHYGNGETEAKLTLKPGTHQITLQFADGAHRAYHQMLTQTIKVTVK